MTPILRTMIAALVLVACSRKDADPNAAATSTAPTAPTAQAKPMQAAQAPTAGAPSLPTTATSGVTSGGRRWTKVNGYHAPE